MGGGGSGLNDWVICLAFCLFVNCFFFFFFFLRFEICLGGLGGVDWVLKFGFWILDFGLFL